jgi:hypothetical protein
MYEPNSILNIPEGKTRTYFGISDENLPRRGKKSIIISSHPRIFIMTDVPGELTDEEILLRAEEIRKSQEAKKAEELKKAEEIRLAEEAKKAEELRKAEEIRKAEEAKKAEELRKAEELVQAEKERKAREAKSHEGEEKKPKKSHKGLKIFGIILLLLIIFAGVVLISADVSISGGTDKSYGYDTNYNVWIPLDKELNIGGYKVIALSPSSGNVMMISLGGVTYPLQVNSVTYVPDQIATLTIFWGKVTVMKIQYEVALTYLGNTNNNEAAFRMLISSDRQLPEFIISLFLSSSGVKVQSV